MILKLGLDNWRLNVYKVYINGDPGLTLATLRQGLIWSKMLIVLIPGPAVR